MWSKITGSFKRQDEPSSSTSQGDVMSRVLEQHPNLSVFHSESSSPPASPSKKKSVFKRFSKAPDASLRPDSPNIMKKVKATFNSAANSSQLSLAASTVMQGSIRSSSDALRRPSLDMLRSANDEYEPSTPNIIDAKFGSARSILRQPNTPGTGQNVRFFSRDAYKVISPNQSVEVEQQALAGMLASADTEFPPTASSLRAEVIPTEIPRAASKSRPTVAEVFSPLREQEATQHASPNASFDLKELDLPGFPPGLGIELEIPPFDSSLDFENSGPVSSTPYRDVKGKGKEKQATTTETLPVAEESVFHSQAEPTRLPTVSHDRSNSFSFGQTMFFSIDNSSQGEDSNRSSAASVDRSLSSISESPASTRATDSPASFSSTKSRSRALSDTVFQSIIRSASRISTNTNSTHNTPESDINDESSTDLVVYSRPTPEPDPFRADANTYYTPQTMIPVTPPRSQNDTVATVGHVRKTSKEESLIYSLQAQLTVQSELVGQYETDLRARDELVEILGKKLSSLEKEETKRRGALRAWKKKVAELEKVCRYLEEEVEGSRQESMERSVMDEASGEALRMLHRQIAQLEREKTDWMRKEEVLREEVDKLEGEVNEKNEEVGKLRDTLCSRDERERELKDGIREAREQMEMMGNVSVGLIDEEELKKISQIQRDLPPAGGEDHHGLTAAEWEEQRAELILTIENLQGEKTTLQLEVQGLAQQLNERDDEYNILKSELEAQWSLTEQNSVKTEALENEVRQLELEKETMKGIVEELEERLNSMEAEWNACEDRKAELENETQELWATNQELDNEHAALEEQLRREQDDVTHLNALIAQRDARIEDLDKERQFILENIERLENNLRRRDAEVEEYAHRVMERESEAEDLREEMNTMKREHARIVDEQNRALQDVASRQGEDKMHIEMALRQKAEVDVEARMSKERVSVLTEEVERLRRQVHDLQQESADREVRLVQANKQIAQAQDDNQGLNIALDSKQQELELLKRKHGVRGTAGSTPAQPSKVGHYRESSVFSTPINSRPPSVMSDSGKEDKAPGSIKAPAALARSTRVNALGVTKPRLEGSMGPPPMKPRPSIATPTPATRAPPLSRSSSAKPAAAAPLRRTSSASETPVPKTKIARVTNPSPIPDEKENFETPAKVKRRSMIPTPA